MDRGGIVADPKPSQSLGVKNQTRISFLAAFSWFHVFVLEEAYAQRDAVAGKSSHGEGGRTSTLKFPHFMTNCKRGRLLKHIM